MLTEGGQHYLISLEKEDANKDIISAGKPKEMDVLATEKVFAEGMI